MVAVVRLVNIRYAIDLYKTRRDEFFLYSRPVCSQFLLESQRNF